ncbi:hypothetical protein F0L68_18505 [Solihabitans fulvus]|uniref:Neutral/alkaline non-lysosomal ceramidase, N-terminal n=1 Tax=Solihabitans fulvus TaxID=1892852 RepID=A0A5B2XDF2_9PSEU|nr:hypothetical protein [Solihabitans fulvus]KAA2261059.1 hypothetical protein F0L68_18505 [Solihabitans fulvus]
MPTSLSMAVGTLDYTPVAPPWPSLWMGGYGAVPRGNQGDVARRLRAHCVALNDGVSTKVLLRVDVVGVPRDLHQAIRDQVLGMISNSADFMMVSSHTHSGPFIGDISPDPYILMGLQPADIDAINGSTQIFMDDLVGLVQSTLAQDLTPVTLGYAEGNVQIGYNRAELPTVLTDVPVLLARNASTNAPLAVLFGYNCHPVARGYDETFDSDYAGFAAEAISAALGVPALFLQGTAGDQDPLTPHQPQQVVSLGQQLADTVLNLVSHGGFTAVTGPISTQLTEINLPLAVDLGNPAAVVQLRDKFRQRLDTLPPDDYAYRHASVMLDQIAGNGLTQTFPMPIQLWKLGGLNLFGLAHEVLSEYHVKLKALAAGPMWIAAYANEVCGYVAGDATIWAGGTKHFGYEAGWTDDVTIGGDGTWPMFYGFPVPFKASPNGVTPPAPNTVERVIVDTCAALLHG